MIENHTHQCDQRGFLIQALATFAGASTPEQRASRDVVCQLVERHDERVRRTGSGEPIIERAVRPAADLERRSSVQAEKEEERAKKARKAARLAAMPRGLRARRQALEAADEEREAAARQARHDRAEALRGQAAANNTLARQLAAEASLLDA